MNTSASEGITPILMGPGGGIVLGIDYSRRIVYWGDTDMSSNLSGTGRLVRITLITQQEPSIMMLPN